MSSGFTVCIVGRPNVGKSTLFNKLTRTRRAIVDDMPGVTRDRMFGFADLEGVTSYLIDTGGFEPDSGDVIVSQVREQARLAIEEADKICFVVDGRDGLNGVDREIAAMLRKSGKPLILAVNKLDSPTVENEMMDFYELGFDKVIAVSAEHSLGLDELAEALVEDIPKDEIPREPEIEEEPESDEPDEAEVAEESEPTEDERQVSIAVVGCPNVGKSSLVNKLLGEKRMTVSDIPGTTRDSVDSLVKWNKKEYLFTDTAGIRKKNRISQKIEKYSVIMALKSIARCDVALLLIDAEKGIRDQDARIGGLISAEQKACVILVNKWDLVEKDAMSTEKFTEQLRLKLKFLEYAPVIFISAHTGQRTGKIFEKVNDVVTEYRKRVDTGPLNRKLKVWVNRKNPPIRKRQRAKFFFGSQIKESPPIFSFVVSRPEAIPDEYKRYLSNRIREEYGFEGAPLIIKFRERKGRN